MPNSFLKTWRVSVEHLRAEGKAGRLACKVLDTLAYVSNQAIPRRLIEVAAKYEKVDNEHPVFTEASSVS
jgi:hypothetical protein